MPQENPSSSEEYSAWLDTIRKNANSFRHMYGIEYNERIPEIGDLLLDRCRGLITIEAVFARMGAQNPSRYWEEILRPLIGRNRVSLRRLQFRALDHSFMTTMQLPSLLTSLQHLRSLELDVTHMPVEDLLPVLDACSSSLEHFILRSNLHRMDSNQESSIAHPHRFPIRLKQLHIYGSVDVRTLEDVLSRLAVHSLEELHVSSMVPLQISTTLRDALWQLTHLHLHLKTMSPNPRRFASHILDSIQPHHLRHVNLNSLDTGCTTQLIEQQHGNLEFLKLGLLPRHTGALAGILATCRKLKDLIFTARPFVDIQTLIDPQRPWVCTELEVFEGTFGLFRPHPPYPSDPHELNDPERSRQVEEQFMQRLGQLTKLRRLVQQDNVNPLLGAEIMEWSLSSGLTHLEGFANLKTFTHVNRGIPKGIGIPELMFMKQHWRGLKELECHKVDHSDLPELLPSDVRFIEVRSILDRPSLYDNWSPSSLSPQTQVGQLDSASQRPTGDELKTGGHGNHASPPSSILTILALSHTSRMVIDIPELRYFIVQYLDFVSLKVFALVCKAWCHDARPLLWKHFSCNSRMCSVSSEEYPVWLDTIHKNANSFRHIYNNDGHISEILDILLDQCHSLVTIETNVIVIDY
ncbi:MAG: hypothetical protein J3Q66DRAFT_421325 [Benniella sp.]|nr:MAG: hypothetical protein J3Q66DRAFT_421325 [Benniella sp.]